jgi:hypothetical protein
MPSISQFGRARIVVGALVAGFAMPSATARAADPSDPKARAAFCESYANLTLADVNHSIQNRCAKTGPAWSSSFAFHYNWCMQEPDLDAVRRTLSSHNLEAMHCQAGAPGGAATSATVFPPVVADEPAAGGTEFPPVVDDATAAAPAGAAPPVVEGAPAPTANFPPVAGAKESTDTKKKSDATEAAGSGSSQKHKRHASEHHESEHLHGDHHLREKVRRAARHFGVRLLRGLADR